MELKDYIERGKALIADYQIAMVCMDEELMDKIVKERQKMEWEIIGKGEDLYMEYYVGIHS